MLKHVNPVGTTYARERPLIEIGELFREYACAASW